MDLAVSVVLDYEFIWYLDSKRLPNHDVIRQPHIADYQQQLTKSLKGLLFQQSPKKRYLFMSHIAEAVALSPLLNQNIIQPSKISVRSKSPKIIEEFLIIFGPINIFTSALTYSLAVYVPKEPKYHKGC